MAFQGNDFPADKYEPVIKFTSKNAPIFTVQLSRYIYSRKRKMETLCTYRLYNHSKLKMERIHNRKRSEKVKSSDLDSVTSDLCLDGVKEEKKLIELYVCWEK